MLIDEVKIYIRSGNGGNGVVAFRREKFVPRGGPSGGDGGRGGDVIFRVNPKLNNLSPFQRKAHFKAAHGGNGGTSRRTGADADDMIIDVPPGTIIRDAETRGVLADLVDPEALFTLIKGGRGGRGNIHYATPSNQTPRFAERGVPGDERWVILELKLIADVGIVGVPNAGKSTLLSVISNARPKIADYPFTTLSPNLGVVGYDDQTLVFADIPGLIEGAHQGVGLGHAFLRHVQRTRLLVHVINGDAEDPVADFNQINAELALYEDRLAEKKQIVVLNKMDLPHVQERWPQVEAGLKARGVSVMAVSAATRLNVQSLIQQVFQAYAELPPEVAELVEVPRYEMEEAEPIFTLTRGDDGSYIVKGKRIERAAAMTYWDYEEAVLRFQKILETLGITAALKEAGVEPGDTVFIGEYELEWAD